LRACGKWGANLPPAVLVPKPAPLQGNGSEPRRWFLDARGGYRAAIDQGIKTCSRFRQGFLLRIKVRGSFS